MEFTLPAGALAHAVGLVKGCVPSRTTIPILNHVLIEASIGTIAVRGTNMDMFAKATSGADVGRDGAAALPGDVLHGIVKRRQRPRQRRLRAIALRSACPAA
jgi:DNA polymerase III subunit beta